MSGQLKLRIEPGDASETWKRSEGRTAAGRFPLLSYLAGSDASAVFLTSIQTSGGNSQEAVIKLIYAGSADTDKQIQHWAAARELNHPHLLRIFDAGRCEIDGMHLLYVVQEYADENLAQILPERPLTAEETTELLPVIVDALGYLHDHGMAHGCLQPSNVLALGNQVKLSTDSVITFGEKYSRSAAQNVYDPPGAANTPVSATGDVWQLGATLVEVLTQRTPAWDRSRAKAPEIPKSMPEPFREIAKHCLEIEPDKRWTLTQINGRINSDLAPALTLVEGDESRRPEPVGHAATTLPTSGKLSPKWPYLLAIAAAIAVIFFLFLMVRPKALMPSSSQSTSMPTSGAPVAGLNPPSQPSVPPQTPQKNITANTEAIPAEASRVADAEGVLHRVEPDISPSARRTIHGRIVVRVKVKVDAAGNVTKATLQSGRGSRYFSRLALESAREWKFSPQPASGQSDERQWNLQFAFTRAKTEMSAVRINR